MRIPPAPAILLAALERELRKRSDEAARAAQQLLPFGAGWLPEEKEQKEQYDADTRHIERRRAELDRELTEEPQRIREQYEVKHHRLERVGVVYLWPATS